MCSYKIWIWLVVIYSIPSIIVLLLGDIVSLVGLNAPHLFQYDFEVNSTIPFFIFHHKNGRMDNEPKLGEKTFLKRISYENQFNSNVNKNIGTDKITDIILKPNFSRVKLHEWDENVPSSKSDIENLTSESIPNVLLKETNEEIDPIVPKNKNIIDKKMEDKIDQENYQITTTISDVQNDQTNEDESEENVVQGSEDIDLLSPKYEGVEHNKSVKKEKNIDQPKASREQIKNEKLKQAWNEFLNGLFQNDQKLILNIFVFVKIGFRILSLVAMPLLIIGNQTSRSSYIRPSKIVFFLQFLFSLAFTSYYAITSTECNYYTNIEDWFLKHLEEPDLETGKNMAKLYLLLTFIDLFPYINILSLVLLNRREKQISRKKDESSEENWPMQLRPMDIPRLKSTNGEHISPLNIHFNQPSTNHNENLRLSAGLITNEEINVNNQPFSYTQNNNQSLNQNLPCYDNHGFSKN